MAFRKIIDDLVGFDHFAGCFITFVLQSMRHDTIDDLLNGLALLGDNRQRPPCSPDRGRGGVEEA